MSEVYALKSSLNLAVAANQAVDGFFSINCYSDCLKVNQPDHNQDESDAPG
jgi:hypothetical protein